MTEVAAYSDIPKKSPRIVMRTATWLNVCYGVVEAVIGGTTGSSAALANGVHNASDGVSHAMHTATHIEEHKEYSRAHAVQKRRRWAAGAIAVGALLTGANAYTALQQHESVPLNTQALIAELGAVSINAGLLTAIRRRKDATMAYTDAKRHFMVDGSIATCTAAAVAANPYFSYADGIGGVVATGASLWLAYRTWQPNHGA